MAVLDVNIHSERSAKARLASYFGKAWVLAIYLVIIVMAVGGITLLFVGSSLGWFILSLACMPTMFIEWYNNELHPLPVYDKGHSIDSVLESDILAKLKNDMSPKQIASIVGNVKSGRFFAVRYGVTVGFLENISSDEVKKMDDVWSTAYSIYKSTNSPVMHGGILVVALIKHFPQHEAILAQVHIDIDDVIAGIDWYNHINKLISENSKTKLTGGIARDWSFGYTPLLNQLGVNLSEGASSTFTVPLQGHEQAISQIMDNLGSGGRHNVALVGGAGVGKTTILKTFAAKLLDADADVPSKLRFSQIYLLDASALVSASPGKGQLEGLVNRVLLEAYNAKNIIICLDNAQLFFKEGVGSVDLTNVLLPIIEAGKLRIILTMDEQILLEIGRNNPSVTNALNRIVINPATEHETLDVMRNQVMMTEYKRGVTYMYQALKESYRLSERYIHDLDMPGKALNLMDNSAGYAEGKIVNAISVQQAIEKTLDVKIGAVDVEKERETLLNLEDKIHERMINQKKAVKVVSDALRRARAGVRNENRPIGTFLFLGPTGVGKTELAKALADVYFGGEDRIIRLDMNQLTSSGDVAKLLADGADNPNSLTAQAMKQPFSVVLLDEIEKAHPDVLDTLLQLLDEGILRDEKNREVSFRDAIVIATSNAGADKIREFIDRGYDIDRFDKQFTDDLINSNQFKPEFLNRFDEIVVFRPLDKSELVQVIDLILAGVNKTLEFQKISVNVTKDAKMLLVDEGYDPRLGARPMRRVVQKTVENTVAKQMLGGNVTPGSTIDITIDDIKQNLGSDSGDSIMPKPVSASEIKSSSAVKDIRKPYLNGESAELDFSILPYKEDEHK